MPAGRRPNTRAGSRRDGHPTCRRRAAHRRCRGALPSRRTTPPMHQPRPAPDCACARPPAERRSRPDRGASRDRGPSLMRSQDGCRIGPRSTRRMFRVADAKRPVHPKATASSCATLQSRRIVASNARRCRHRARLRPGPLVRRHARSPPAPGPAARESARHAARSGAVFQRSRRPPSTPAAAGTIRAGESTRKRQRPARRRATCGAPLLRHLPVATCQSGSPTPSSLNASRSPGWQSR